MVLAPNEHLPMAILQEPLVFDTNEHRPMATLLVPVVRVDRLLIPNTTFPLVVSQPVRFGIIVLPQILIAIFAFP